ncbi:MAG: helix-turn-helix transcriptional regulator [Actinomycetota bacterium]
MSEYGKGRLGRRLGRILVLLPYAIKHPGVSVGELSARFGVRRRDIIDDLELVFLCGLPGYGPGDLIDVSIDDDRVHVRMADYFGAPLRLTPAEALALYAGGHVLAALPEMQEADALRRALDKLGGALGLEGDGDGRGIELKLQPGPVAHLTRLRAALEQRRRIRLQYLSASRGELSDRVVEPWALIVAWGRSYLVGWDHLSNDERMFRTDRIKLVELLDEPAEVPADFDPEPYSRAFVERSGERIVSFEVSPSVARWFADYYPVRSSTELDDGWLRIELATAADLWAATLLLRLGVEVRSVQPPEVVAEARRVAASIAARHGQGSSSAGT